MPCICPVPGIYRQMQIRGDPLSVVVDSLLNFDLQELA